MNYFDIIDNFFIKSTNDINTFKTKINDFDESIKNKISAILVSALPTKEKKQEEKTKKQEKRMPCNVDLNADGFYDDIPCELEESKFFNLNDFIKKSIIAVAFILMVIYLLNAF